MNMDRQMDGWTDRRTGGQIDKYMEDKLIDRRADGQLEPNEKLGDDYTQIERWIDRQMDGWIYRQMDGWIDRQMAGKADIYIEDG